MYFSKSTLGFYDKFIHGTGIPADAVEVTTENYAALMAAQASGQIVQASEGGRPVAVDRLDPTTEEQAVTVRAERDRRIAATDYLIMLDYPISADTLAAVKVYRQELRDLPAQGGFPWGGDVLAVPWPEQPAV